MVLYALQLDFLSEAEMMKWFDHKNIVKLLGVCTRGEPVYAVMEFMLHGMLSVTCSLVILCDMEDKVSLSAIRSHFVSN